MPPSPGRSKANRLSGHCILLVEYSVIRNSFVSAGDVDRKNADNPNARVWDSGVQVLSFQGSRVSGFQGHRKLDELVCG